MRYNPEQIETCMVQCSRQCSNNSSLRDVVVYNFRVGTWSEDFGGSFQKSFNLAARLLVRMINILEVCHEILPGGDFVII